MASFWKLSQSHEFSYVRFQTKGKRKKIYKKKSCLRINFTIIVRRLFTSNKINGKN